MTNDTLNTYYDRMSASLGDKTRVLPYVKGERVLDVGCGSGDLLDTLLCAGYDAYGLDASEESVERVSDQSRVRHAYADEITDVFEPESFDTIICSSVFHEVFSYGNRDGNIGRTESVESALKSIRKALVPGGRLIVRDGVEPASVGLFTMIVDSNEAVQKFLDYSPFNTQYRAYDFDRSVSLYHQGGNVWEGSASSLMEFAFTYTWGSQSFEREVREFYGLFTLGGYASFVERQYFTTVSAQSYTQPGYATHLEGKVRFPEMPFPATNALWVYDKSIWSTND